MLRGFAREDLFTVVLEHFQTDTADYADILLPATTQLEHFDCTSSYGHLYVIAQPAGDRAARRGAAEHARSSAASPRGWASTTRSSRDDDLTLIAQALDTNAEKLQGVTFDALRENGLGAAQRADAVPAVRRGRIPHAEREVRVLLAADGGAGTRSRCRRSPPPYEFPENAPGAGGAVSRSR